MKNNNDIIISKGNKYSKVIDLLYSAKQSGVDIILNKDQLQLKLQEDKTFDEKLLLEIRNHKQLIIEFLSRKNLKSEKIDNSYNKIRQFDRNKITNIPLSFSQERLWFIDQMEGSVQYHIPDILRLKGKLNQEALKHALLNIVNRHEILRTVILDLDGVGYQCIEERNDCELNIIDGDKFQEDAEGLQKYIKALINEPFNLSKDHLLRVRIIKLNEDEHVLLIVLHHIVSDAWSKSILVKEVAEIYKSYVENRPARLQKLPVQYADFAVWQRNHLQGEILDKKINYWKQKLSNTSALNLPTDFSRPAILSNDGATLYFKIKKDISSGLQALSAKSGTTSFMTILAGLQVLLHRYSGQEDICVGTPIAGRQQPEVEGLIGFFINTLALRSEVNGDKSFTELLEQVRSTTMEAYDHQDVPFEKIVETVVKERDLSRTPLFQVMLILQNTPEVPKLRLGELTLSKEGSEHTSAKFDLSFIIQETSEGLRGSVQYNTSLYKADTIKHMVVHFEELLGSIVNNPKEKISRLKMLTSAEANQLQDFNNTATGLLRNKTVINLFEKQVEISGDNTALIYEKQEFTYKELNDRSNQVARHLIKKGVKENTLVPICIERGFEMVAGIIGILKTGAAYVPLDPEYPAERISYMVEDTGAKIILSSKQSRERLTENIDVEVIEMQSPQINEESKENLQTNIKPGNLAYVIYTSGSTGRPKGVMIEHASLVNYLTNGKANYINNETKGAASFLHLSFTFDGSITALFMPLIAGKPIVIASNKFINVFEDENLQKYAPFDFIKITPSHLELLSDLGDSKNWLAHKLVIGGEALHSGHLKPFVSRGISVEIINEYGPTETTVGCSTYNFNTLESGIQNDISIGKPIDNMTMYIVNEGGQLQPIGVPGEIYIGGAGVARGYLNRQELTVEKFIADPFGIRNPFSSNGEQLRLYRSGDLGRWQADGNIEYLGRIDDQVKIRGYRIELGEIENVILQSHLVEQAVVLAIAGGDGNKQLAGYIVPKGIFEKQQLLNYLESKLPGYMVPAIWVEVAEMPLTQNGKIDKKALSALAIESQGNEYVAPLNEVEEKLVAIWQQQLHIERVGTHDNFFELGGHSLLAMRMVSAVRKQLAVEMPIKELFLYPTIAKLALQLQGNHRASVLSAIKAGERPAHIPLSFSQERLWFIDQMEGSVQYHIPVVLRLKGQLDKGALSSAFQQIINRHEALRTVFIEENGEVRQQVAEPGLWELEEEDGKKYEENKGELKSYIQQQIRKPFDLSKDNMLRASLVTLSEEEYILVVTMHHIASDGWSMPILIREVTELYAGYAENKEIELKPLPVQYADYSIWQRNYLQGEILEKKIGYWKEKLSNVASLELPTDYQRPSVQSTKGAAIKFSLEKGLGEELHALSQREGTTLFMTMLAALNVLLYRYSGQQDICIGSPVANRTQEEIEGLIGFFVNTLALRTEVNATGSFVELLQQVKTTTMAAYDHQDVPFEKVVEAVVKERDLSRSPLFQVMLALQNAGAELENRGLGTVEISRETIASHTTKFDMTFSITENAGGLHGSLEYNTGLYKEETIERMIVHFEELLRSIVKNPQEKIAGFKIVTTKEEDQLLKEFVGTRAAYPKDKSITDLFEEQVQKTPGNVALVFEEEEITYQELNNRSNQLARYLQKKGVKAETLIPICVERSAEMIIGILGILKAGGGYVPIDPEYPADRISYMLEDTGAEVIVSSMASKVKLPAEAQTKIITIDADSNKINEQSQENLGVNITAENLAYVIYTSGSTGKPKGVLVEHGNVVSLVRSVSYVSLASEDRLLSTGSSSFDATTFEYWGMLLNGGQLILCEEARLLNSDLLKAEILRRRVTKMWFTSSWLNQLVENDITIFESLQTILAGGEKLSEQHIQKIRQAYPGIEIINGYGPTENTTFSLTHNVNETDLAITASIPIGRPLENRSAYIIDQFGQLVPIGVPGEIFLGGAGLARGYLNQPVLTAERFIQNPLSEDSKARIYKTGDLGRWQADGTIEYLGRIDDQVKIRGYRIELGEIENVIQQSGMVKHVVIMARSNNEGSKYLAGYIVAGEEFDKETLTKYLHSQLPEYMVPGIWVQIEQLPITTNGKVDKKALPEPEISELLSNEYVAPLNEVEEKLVAIWQQQLHIERVGTHDNFFELGGHSLLAMRMVSAVRKQLAVEMPIKELFLYPTIAKLALQLQGNHRASVLSAIKAGERPAHIPLSFSQERLWFIDQMEGSVQYHIPVVLRLKGQLDKGALSSAFQQIINRHEALRTVFIEENGEVRQQVAEPGLWELEEEDGKKYEENKGELKSYIQQQIRKPFDLSKDNMLRASLVTLSEEEYILVVTMHHIASDGWSMPILIREVTELYAGYAENKEIELKPLPVQYADYSIWQRNYLQGEILEKKIGYWKEKLSNVASLELPTDYQRPSVQSTKGAAIKFSLEKGLGEELHALSQREGTTLFMTMLAALNVLLYRYSGQQDICIGSPVANRTQEEIEGLIGFFVNTLALRTEVNATGSFVELLQQVKTTTMAAYDHQDVPFEKVVEAVVKERDLSRSPLFQVMLALQNAGAELENRGLGTVEISRETIASHTTKFDMTFSITENAGGLHGSLEYNTGLYKEETIERMIVHFEELLRSIVKNPQEKIAGFKIVTTKEEDQLLKEFVGTRAAYPKDKSITDLFEEQVQKTPGNVALVFEEEEITYQELNNRSNQLARYLQKKGVKAETLIPICVERSAEMIIGILGILKAGGGYVPIDPEYPADRISYMLEDTGAEVIVSSMASKVKLPAEAQTKIITIDADSNKINEQSQENLGVNITAENLAYVIYTSGSTGKPKGVLVEHGNVVSLVRSVSYVSLASEDRLLSTGSSSFDATTFEYWGMLLNGGQLILCEEARLLNSDLLKAEILRRRVTKMWFTSSWLNQLVENDITIFESLQTILAGGEKLSEQHIQKIRQAYPGIEIINGYGPTENTTFSLTHNVNETDLAITASIPIGRPLENRSAYIIDQFGQLVPIGVPGEIFLGGAGLARGYLNQPVLTAERFIQNPLSEDSKARIYKTGDLGRWQADGTIEYLGRIDDQVKIRGYRIELGEIENVLMQNPTVRQAVVLAPTNKAGHKYLVGYIAANGEFDKPAITAYLRNKLPAYMIPGIWIQIEKIPLTSNGKVDKKALPEADASLLVHKEYIAPGNKVEEDLAEIWKELLGLERVGRNDNFFEIGGDSILSIQVVSRAKRLGYDLKPKEIFMHQTVASLSIAIAGQSESGITGEQGMLKGGAGLLPIQQWYLENTWNSVSHFNQSVLLQIDKTISPNLLDAILEQLLSQHDALRFKYFKNSKAEWCQEYGTHFSTLVKEDLRSVSQDQIAAVITQKAEAYQRSLNIETGDLVRMVWMQTPDAEEQNRLLIIIHHLAVDGVSWRILIENVEFLITAFQSNQNLDLGVKTTSYRQWYEALKQYGENQSVLSQVSYWKTVLDNYRPLLTCNNIPGNDIPASIKGANMMLEATQTTRLIQDVPKTYNTEINDILLCALSMTLSTWGKTDKVTIGLEGHGREEIAVDIDTTRTVGWFTNLYPILIDMNSEEEVGGIIKSVKKQLRSIPDKGLGFGVLKYINKEDELSAKAQFNIVFNYLGQLDSVVQKGKRFAGARESAGQSISDEHLLSEHLTVTGSVKGGRLTMTFRYNTSNYTKESIADLIKNYQANLALIIDHCIRQQELGLVTTHTDDVPDSETSFQKYNASAAQAANNKYLIPIKTGGKKVPLYIVAGGGGTARKFMNFAKLLDTDQPVYSLQPPLDYADVKHFPKTIEEIAALFIEEMVQQNPEGAFSLSGHCTGGLVAIEMARQLKAMGKKVHQVVMFDTVANKVKKEKPKKSFQLNLILMYLKRFIYKAKLKFDFEFFLLRKYKKKAIQYKINSLRSLIKKIKKDKGIVDKEMEALEALKYSEDLYTEAHKKYQCFFYEGELVVFYAKERYYFTDAEQQVAFKKVVLDDRTKNLWKQYAKSLTIHETQGDHSTMFETEHAKGFADTLQQYLNSN